MTLTELEELVPQVFERIHKRSALNFHYKFRPNAGEKKLLHSFVEWLNSKYEPHDLNGDFIVNFFTFQFSRYLDARKYLGKKQIMFSWLVGPKAQQVWEGREISSLANYKVKKAYQRANLNLDLGSFKQQKVKNHFKVDQLNRGEEVEKERFINTPIGYLHCRDLTTLYNPKSLLCQGCTYKNMCILRLKQHLPLVYQVRLNNN